ncbi:Rieske (2Fe-2S) protein [Halocatena halophila]|uniref:Rieske (2Fe-2S) protein n=1 Tax=Halocatena halophila TaxID=2814576 RepID=UPI002ED2F540
MAAREAIVGADSVPDESTFLFTVREVDTDTQREAILVRTGDGIAGWFNYCQHLTDVALDKGSGASMRDDEIVCVNHGAMFNADSGECTYGPCPGAVLESIDVTTDDGTVWLTEAGYAFDHAGPIETDPAALESSSNVQY